MLPCVAVCCRVLQCVAVCCSVLQCVAVRCSAWHPSKDLLGVTITVYMSVCIYIMIRASIRASLCNKASRVTSHENMIYQQAFGEMFQKKKIKIKQKQIKYALDQPSWRRLWARMETGVYVCMCECVSCCVHACVCVLRAVCVCERVPTCV